MKSEAKVSIAMTKKEIIEEYNRLLDAFNEEATARKEADSRLGELEKKQDREALDVGLQATVGSILEGAGRLRALMGSTLNELGDKMTEQAERLEMLNRAVTLQEARLKDLHKIEYAADTMGRLAAAYVEERNRIETEHAFRVGELERGCSQKTEEIEMAFSTRQAELEQETEEARARWDAEEEETEKRREREQAEYEYERDRSRRLDEDAYAEKTAALKKDLRSLRAEAEQAVSERAATIQAKEEEFQRMAAEIDGFSEKLETAVLEAREEAITALRIKMDHQASLADVEREWERKSLEQTIAHLQEVNESLEGKLHGLTAELGDTRKQVNVIAEKAIEGASITKAFESVNQIALEQARKPVKSPKE